ncbi:hypothetical protein OF122_13095 [Pelagibacterium flavum]|uniref:ABC transporter permease n=1 Tax=Pelagibacterium flavum TaxID=2984530 RepID=A0ABY6IP10_9HYPH|nr:hypothetical protein [Pelagibacterium sp. YIM 151497]UYQ70995.1 hypothetical protein OF122_13095 [Pelagibacterium sp. YIM 151497]
MKALSSFIVKPSISPGTMVVAVLAGNSLSNGHWLTAAIVFVVGMVLLGLIAFAAGEA